jgi:hypothetical protein
MTKIAFGVNDRSGFLRASLVPLNRPQEKHSKKLFTGAFTAFLLLGAAGLFFLLAR